MAKVPKVPVNSFLLLSRRRSYAVAAAENVRVQSAIRKVGDDELGSVRKEGAVEKERFWMRDPKTGNWIPETHFGKIDVVELREKFLSNSNKDKL